MNIRTARRLGCNAIDKLWQAIACPPYRGLAWLLWSYVLLSVLILDQGGVFTGHLIGYDDQVRMAQVLDWINNPRGLLAGWYDHTLARADPPQGFTTIWSRIVDVPIAIVVLIAQNVMPQKIAALVAAAVIPMLELAVLFAAGPYFARPLVGKAKARLFNLFILFTSILNIRYFSVSGFVVGEASHHPWYVILDLLLFGATARLVLGSASYAPIFMLGLAISLLTAVGIEGYPMIAGAVAILASIAWAKRRPRLAGRATRAVFCGAAGALALLPLYQPPSHFFYISFAEPSLLGVILIVTAAVFLQLEFFLLRVCGHNRPFCAAALIMLTMAMGGGLITAFPALLDGAAAGLLPAERAMALHEHFEARPVYTLARTTSEGVSFIAPMALAGLIGAYAAWRARGRRRALHFCYLGFAALGCGMSLQFSRYYHHAMTTSCAWLLWAWEKMKGRLPDNRHYSLLALLAFTALGPFWMLLLPAFAFNLPVLSHVVLFPAALQASPDPCDSLSLADFINAHYGKEILLSVPTWQSQQIFYQIDGRLDFLANYPSHDRFIDNVNFFNSRDAEVSRQIAARHHIELIAVCRTPSYYIPNMPDDLQPMLGRLQMNRPPNWLRSVDVTGVATNYALYQTDPVLLYQTEKP